MEVKAEPIVDWIKENVPPLTWTVITLRHMTLFLDAKISPSKINETTVFNVEIVQGINDVIREKYNKELPSNLIS